ncbi:hypothetical protein [Actinocorallia libanotica]
MLYEITDRATEILSLDVEDLDVENRRAPLSSRRLRAGMRMSGVRAVRRVVRSARAPMRGPAGLPLETVGADLVSGSRVELQ